MSIYTINPEQDAIEAEGFDMEIKDPSVNGSLGKSLECKFSLDPASFKSLFLTKYKIDYICDLAVQNKMPLRIISHPYETDTCYEKAELLGSWNPLNVIKALYLESSNDRRLFPVVIPETGCFINRTKLAVLAGLPQGVFFKKAEILPEFMSFGTCSPFIADTDLKYNGGSVEKVIFDSRTLQRKKQDRTLDDFSFGLDHRMSLQINYYDCFQILSQIYPNVVTEKDVLTLSFREKLVRNKGRINITFDFDSLDYDTAVFLNDIHGYGEVSVVNDYCDELDDSMPGRKWSYKDVSNSLRARKMQG